MVENSSSSFPALDYYLWRFMDWLPNKTFSVYSGNKSSRESTLHYKQKQIFSYHTHIDITEERADVKTKTDFHIADNGYTIIGPYYREFSHLTWAAFVLSPFVIILLFPIWFPIFWVLRRRKFSTVFTLTVIRRGQKIKLPAAVQSESKRLKFFHRQP
ncbi:MAG: hypothetical protein AB7G80_03020 [Dongiaceae bacterium]